MLINVQCYVEICNRLQVWWIHHDDVYWLPWIYTFEFCLSYDAPLCLSIFKLLAWVNCCVFKDVLLMSASKGYFDLILGCCSLKLLLCLCALSIYLHILLSLSLSAVGLGGGNSCICVHIWQALWEWQEEEGGEKTMWCTHCHKYLRIPERFFSEENQGRTSIYS